jgi:exodeoxyribonuclease V alpha subunit
MMRAENFPLPEHLLAQGFADHAVAWARECDAPVDSLRLLRRAAYETSLATSEGHVCVMLSEIAYPDNTGLSERRKLMLASGVVGTPDVAGTMPLILDSDGRIYLHRYFDFERRLASRLIATKSEINHIGDECLKLRLDLLFQPNQSSDRPDWQKIAVALAMQKKLTIISGGPGTGKTTTVVNLLACLIAMNPDCRIALAAPTGKAAARMQEAIRAHATRLPPEVQFRFPSEAFTIHRLLGVMPVEGTFLHHSGNPLAIDTLVVDEASMLDVALASRLLDAVPQHARIILLGDKDQLSAVEAGAVFSEISANPELTAACISSLAALTDFDAKLIAPPSSLHPSALQDSVIWFTENYRFTNDSGIGKFASMINAGDVETTVDWLRARVDASVTWIDDHENKLTALCMQHIFDGYADYLHALRQDLGDKVAIFDAFDRFRTLCALRTGSRGVVEINQVISKYFIRSLNYLPDAEGRSGWYPGRPIIVQRNDYLLRLFNGDIGIALPEILPDGSAGKLMVYFPDDDSGFRAIAPLSLPEHETAFAMSVHKSQGSEFESILLILPTANTRAVCRELLYTAITRARSHVCIVSNRNVLEQAIKSPTQRRSGLIRRLEEASASSF